MNIIKSSARGGITLGLLVALCVPASTQTPKSAGDFWPMKVGSTWRLSTKVNGKSTNQDVKVVAVAPEKGGYVATLDYLVNGTAVQKEIYRVTGTSMARIASGQGGSSKLTPPLPIVQFPLTAGKKWKWKGVINTQGQDVQGDAVLTVSGPDTIKTPAGTFKAMKVSSTLNIMAQGQKMSFPNAYWFAPGVGLVQQTATLGPTKVEAQLVSYKLKK